MEIRTYTKIAVDMDNNDLDLLRNASNLVTSLIITMDKNKVENITCNDYDGGRSFTKEDLRRVTDILEYLQDIDEIY